MRAAAIGVALAGLGIAGYLTAVHYAGGEPVCAIAPRLRDRAAVATTRSSAGVPVAAARPRLGYVAILASLARDGEDWRTAAAFLSLAGLGLLGLADLRRGRRAARHLHLVRRLGAVHAALAALTVGPDARRDHEGGGLVSLVTRPSAESPHPRAGAAPRVGRPPWRPCVALRPQTPALRRARRLAARAVRRRRRARRRREADPAPRRQEPLAQDAGPLAQDGQDAAARRRARSVGERALADGGVTNSRSCATAR